MTISYPISMPTNTGVVEVSFEMDIAGSLNESPYTYKTYLQEYQGERWLANISFPTLTREQSELWECFFMQLRKVGTFYLGDPLRESPRGNWSGLPKVNGANQTGKTINLNGFVEGATIYPGDYFQIDTRLYRHIGYSTAVADSNGAVTLDIFPRLRNPLHADGSSVVTDAPKGVFRLPNEQRSIFKSVQMEYFGIPSITAVEVV